MTADKAMTKEEFAYAYGFYTIEVENRGTTMAKSKKVPTPQFMCDLNALIRQEMIRYEIWTHVTPDLTYADWIVTDFLKSQQ